MHFRLNANEFWSFTIVFRAFQGMDRWSNDLCFGAQRLIGCNPTLVKLCTELPERWVYFYFSKDYKFRSIQHPTSFMLIATWVSRGWSPAMPRVTFFKSCKSTDFFIYYIKGVASFHIQIIFQTKIDNYYVKCIMKDSTSMHSFQV